MAQRIRIGLAVKLLEEFKTIKSTKKELREFGISVGIVFVLLALVAGWKTRSWNFWLAGPGGALILLGVFWPALLKPLQKIWMSFALVLGFFMTRVLLSLLFILAVTPIALMTRLAGKKFLDKSWKDGRDSFWVLRENSARRADHWFTQY